MRTHARVVIVGAGIAGCSAAYHLTQLGWHDILVLDKGPLFETGGSTTHAPGLIFQTNYSKMMTEFARYTVNLLKPLHYAGEQCVYQVGGIEVAATPARWEELKRKQGVALSYGLESHLLTPEEVKRHIPILNDRAILGGYYVPTDADVRGWHCAAALAQAAMNAGVEFQGNVEVLDIPVRNGRARAVLTDQGLVECEFVLLCTNVWASVLADKVGLRFPLLGVEHQLAYTEPLAELAADRERFVTHPILRHQDYSLYYRQWYDGYAVGNYRHESLLLDGHQVGARAERAFTPEHFTVAQAATDELLPPLKGKRFVRAFNGYMAFSNDLYPIVGQTRIRGLWAALGVWVTHSGGVGKAVAQLMTSGECEWDLREADINRFHPHDYTRRYMRARVDRQYQEVYDIIHPLQQMEKPRNLRLAPFHARLEEQGAVNFASAGWEVPQWYEDNARLLEEFDSQIPHREGWAARYWSRIQGAEHLATRARCGLFNLSTFTKIEVSGPGALGFLESITANRIDRPVGTVVYTSLCNSRGGIMADLTVSRLEDDRFWILTGGGVGPHDLAWIRQHAPTSSAVDIRDMSGQYTTLGLWGPRARDILQQLCEEDVSDAALPFYSVRPLHIECVPALALRISYAGELGWEIYAPIEYGLRLWDLLWEAGRPHGLVAGGAGAFDSLRLEKGYRLWGSDIHSEYNPYEAGLGWAVRLNKGYFLGREALIKAKENVARKLCCLTLDEPGAMALGKEPLLVDDRVVGYVTSANYGYSIGQHIVYGYLPRQYAQPGTKVEVQYFGKRQGATVRAEPLFDPSNARMKA